MTDRRDILLVELENLQTQRRNAVEAYMSSGDRNHWREVREVSQSIADKLGELEAARPAPKDLDSLDEAIEELMVAQH